MFKLSVIVAVVIFSFYFVNVAISAEDQIVSTKSNEVATISEADKTAILGVVNAWSKIEVGFSTWLDLTMYQINKNESTESKYKKFGWDLGRTNIPITGKITDKLSAKTNVRYENQGDVYTAQSFYFNVLTVNYSNMLFKGLSATAGKMQVPFAQSYSPLAIDTYLYVSSNTPYTIVQNPSSPTNYFSNSSYFGLKTNKVGFTLAYDLEKTLKLQLTVFESSYKSGTSTSGTTTTTYYAETGDQDNGIWQSQSAKLNFYLIPGLDFVLSYINDYDSKQSKRSSIAYSTAMKYNMKYLELFGEFLVGKTHANVNQTYYQGGAGLKFTEKHSFYGMYENMYLNSFGAKTKLMKIAVGPKMNLAKGTDLIGTYVFETASAAIKTNAQAFKIRLTYAF